MPCYEPIPAVLVSGRDGRKQVSFSRDSVGKGISLPCGYCLGCSLERSRQWAVRCMHEAKMHDENIFVTLTYDPAFLPADGSISKDTCQRFLKRLRRAIDPVRIKFFLCGEYGEQMGRPHYHAIIFGWWPPDAVYFKGSGEQSLFTSAVLSKAWGFGFASFGSVSFDSAAYVARYALKKLRTNRAAEAARLSGRTPEFLLMSRGGRDGKGIAAAWIRKFTSDVFPSDEVLVRGVPSRPPRYYDSFLEESCPEMLARLKVRREAQASALEEILLKSGASVFVAPSRNARRLKVRETVARAKLSLKSRSLEK